MRGDLRLARANAKRSRLLVIGEKNEGRRGASDAEAGWRGPRTSLSLASRPIVTDETTRHTRTKEPLSRVENQEKEDGKEQEMDAALQDAGFAAPKGDDAGSECEEKKGEIAAPNPKEHLPFRR